MSNEEKELNKTENASSGHLQHLVIWFMYHVLRKPCCQGVDEPCYKIGKKQRQNTAYIDDSLNWVVMCDECAKHNETLWEERWNELNSGRI